jgi:predicted AAA+ superfamily ATPase
MVIHYFCGMEEIIRSESKELVFKLGISPAVVILGPRQVGKTTLALQTARQLGHPYLYLDLESEGDLTKLDIDPESFLDYYDDQLIIIDEVQTLPILFNRMRSVIDKDRRNGRFMLLGSASPQLVKGVSESLAGRISYLDLPPFKLLDLFPEYSMEHHWFRGGFPL